MSTLLAAWTGAPPWVPQMKFSHLKADANVSVGHVKDGDMRTAEVIVMPKDPQRHR